MKSFSGDEGYQAPCSPLCNRARVLHSQLCRLHSACKHSPVGGAAQSALVYLQSWNISVICAERVRVNIPALLMLHFHCKFAPVKENVLKLDWNNQLRSLTKTLTCNPMLFWQPSKRPMCPTLQLNTTSIASAAFLYKVYKSNCGPLQLFAAIIACQALWVALSALPF